MVDDELPEAPPTRGGRSWTNLHRSATTPGRGLTRRRDRHAHEFDEEPAPDDVDAPGDAEPAIGTAAVPVLRPDVGPGASEDDHAWLDQDAGPVVRPYTLTGGRSRPVTSDFGLLTHVEALYAPEADLVALQPEHRAILSLTRTALSVAELAARLDLAVGVVRVLIGDLLQANLVSTFEADAAIRAPDDHILQAVIDGLRAL